MMKSSNILYHIDFFAAHWLMPNDFIDNNITSFFLSRWIDKKNSLSWMKRNELFLIEIYNIRKWSAIFYRAWSNLLPVFIFKNRKWILSLINVQAGSVSVLVVLNKCLAKFRCKYTNIPIWHNNLLTDVHFYNYTLYRRNSHNGHPYWVKM